MRNPIFALFIHVCLLTSYVYADALPDKQPSSDDSSIDEVLVIGEQPGPKLWKVYKDDHVLWVMGTLSPVPKKMQWRSKQVETVLADSQEMLTPASINLQVNFFTKISLLPSLIGITNNPDKKKLVEILPADIYERWLVLKKKYIGDDEGIEKQRPIFAANELYEKSIEKIGLVNDKDVNDAINKLAKKNKVTVNTLMIKQDMKNPRSTVKGFKKMPLDDVACFAKIIERLEIELDVMRQRANAWAVGDIEALRKLPSVDSDTVCLNAILQTAFAEEQNLQDAPQRIKTYWVDSAEKALANNQSTFAVLPIAEILKPDGYIAALQAKNYTVEGQGF